MNPHTGNAQQSERTHFDVSVHESPLVQMLHALDDFSHDGANREDVGSLGLINVEETAIGGGHDDEVSAEVHVRRKLSS